MRFLRRHTVYFSFWLHRFCWILIGNITSKAWFIGRNGQGSCVGPSQLWGSGWGRTCTSGAGGTAGIVGAAVGSECELQLLLGLEHFWNRGSWEILPNALFEQLFPLPLGAVWRRGVLSAVSQMISTADLYGFHLGIYFRGVWLVLSQEDFGSLFLEVGGLLRACSVYLGLLGKSRSSCIVSPCCMEPSFIGHPALGLFIQSQLQP